MISRRAITLGSAAAAVSMIGFVGTSRAAPAIFVKNGYAIGGYDPANYFTVAKATVGKPTFTTQWKGVTWEFATQSNLDAFLASPEKFAPQFNGYCPFCLAGGRLVEGVGSFWSIYKDKLYLLIG